LRTSDDFCGGKKFGKCQFGSNLKIINHYSWNFIADLSSIPVVLNLIPLATLAAVLIMVGYKLAKPATFKHFWHLGNSSSFLSLQRWWLLWQPIY
jgi:hypothetical protein